MAERAAPLAGRRVLIVENEAWIALGIEEEARRLGCSDIVLAFSRQQALDAMTTFRPDLAIVEVALTGTGMCYAIADALADRAIPFIVSSAYRADDLPDRHGQRPFVGKPMLSGDFARAVDLALMTASNTGDKNA